ncbi:hypothetical protein BC833DRAFT_611789 [Globomyces pollinis-pini]|nr:hypothetical protein BC833DRAFT_611789 [Globomyces pollinis-pini]
MFDRIYSFFTNKVAATTETVLDTVVRPQVLSTATSHISEIKASTLKTLPTDLKKLILADPETQEKSINEGTDRAVIDTEQTDGGLLQSFVQELIEIKEYIFDDEEQVELPESFKKQLEMEEIIESKMNDLKIDTETQEIDRSKAVSKEDASHSVKSPVPSSKTPTTPKTPVTPVTPTTPTLASNVIEKILRRKEKKLDELLERFVENLKPALDTVLEGSELKITDYAMYEIKVTLGVVDLEPLPPSEELSELLTEGWPVIDPLPDNAEIEQVIPWKVRQNIRPILQRLLPNLLETIPDMLTKVTQKMLHNEVLETVEENMTGFQLVDNVVNRIGNSKKTVKLINVAVDEFCDLIWKSQKSTMIIKLKSILIDVENSVIQSVESNIPNIPLL